MYLYRVIEDLSLLLQMNGNLLRYLFGTHLLPEEVFKSLTQGLVSCIIAPPNFVLVLLRHPMTNFLFTMIYQITDHLKPILWLVEHSSLATATSLQKTT